MKRLIARTVMVRTAFVVFLLSAESHAQSGAAIPQADAGHMSQTSCVILKRMGRLDRAKSRLPSLGMTGKQFRYVEGKLPEGFSPHHKMTDHDVRNLQFQGAQVLVLDSHYTSEDLKDARANCQGQTDKVLNQAEAKAPPAPPRGSIAGSSAHTPNAPAPETLAQKAPPAETLTPKASGPNATPETTASKTPTPEASTLKTSAPDRPISKTPVSNSNDTASSPDTTVAALVDVSSTPAGADVYIDEHLFGHTPATTIILMPGNHNVVIKKNGFIVWKKKFNLPSGHTNVDAALVPKAK